MSTTPNYNWFKPDDGDSLANNKPWGASIRKFMTDVDTLIKDLNDTQAANWDEFNIAIQNASDAISTIDGEIVSYWQDEAPSTANVGDFWFDTNNNNAIHVWTGSQWVISSSKIAQALLLIHTVQGVADGKAKIYYQDSMPTGMTSFNEGDMWVDTAEGHGLAVYVYANGAGWILAQDSFTALQKAQQALDQLTDIASDGKLTANEKVIVKSWWTNAQLEYSDLVDRAGEVDLSSSQIKDYTDAYTILLNTTVTVTEGGVTTHPLIWNVLDTSDLSTLDDLPSPFVAPYPSFYDRWSNYWTQRTKLQNLITGTVNAALAALQSQLTDINADGKLSPSEKAIVKSWYANVLGEYQDIIDKSILSEVDNHAYRVKLALLNNTKINGTLVWELPGTTDITGTTNYPPTYDPDNSNLLLISTTFYTRWSDYWVQKNLLQNAISDKNRSDLSGLNDQLTQVISDGYLSTAERITVRGWWTTAQSEFSQLTQQCTTAQISTSGQSENPKYLAFYNKYYALDGIKSIWSTSVTEPLEDITYLAASAPYKTLYDYWSEYWVAREELKTIIHTQTYAKASDALASAIDALDGIIVTYYQASAPTSGMSEGDIWFDTDDSNKIYVYRSGVWTYTPDYALAKAILAAKLAGDNADSKTTTFFQSTTPTAKAKGDIWVNTTSPYNVKVWDSSSWVLIQDWDQIVADRNSLNNILSDGKLTDNEKPTLKAWWATAAAEKIDLIGSDETSGRVGSYNSAFPSSTISVSDYTIAYNAINALVVPSTSTHIWDALAGVTVDVSSMDVYTKWSNYWSAASALKNLLTSKNVDVLKDIISDNKLTDNEKTIMKSWWATVVSEYSTISSTANVDTSNYITAYNNLNTGSYYVSGGTSISPTKNLWQTLTGTSDITVDATHYFKNASGVSLGAKTLYDLWSDYWTEKAKVQNLSATGAFSLATAATDGSIQSYFQNTAPVSGTPVGRVVSAGDIWFNTANSYEIKTYINGTWTATPDSSIAKAILSAQTSLGTSDNTQRSYYTTNDPSKNADNSTAFTYANEGDIWVNITDPNNPVIKVWNGTSLTWVAAPTWIAANHTNLATQVNLSAIMDSVSAVVADNKISISEKPSEISRYNTALTDQETLVNKARFVKVDFKEFSDAWDTLKTYINNVDNKNFFTKDSNGKYVDTVINGATYWNNWNNYENAKTKLISNLAMATKMIDAIAVSNVNLTTTIPNSFDGMSINSSNTVLLANQSNTAENGFYDVEITSSSSTGLYYPTDNSTSSFDSANDGGGSLYYNHWGPSGTAVSTLVSGTLSVTLSSVSCNYALARSASVTVSYSIDSGQNWTILKTYTYANQTEAGTALTATITNVSTSQIQVKIDYIQNTYLQKPYNWKILDDLIEYTLDCSGTIATNGIKLNVTSSTSSLVLTRNLMTITDKEIYFVRRGNTYGGYNVSISKSGNTFNLPFSKFSPISEPYLAAPNTDGYILASTTNGVRSWIMPTASSGGTVTSLSVTTNNGFAGSFSSSATTPALTIKLNNLSGLLKGDGLGAVSGITNAAGILSNDGSGNFTYVSTSNWDSAYTDRMKWDGGNSGLTASTGRSSLGATTVGSNLFTLANPSVVSFLQINSDNTVTTLSASSFRTAIGAGTSSTTGTVTSVGLSLPSIFNVTTSSVNSSGTLTASFYSQTANTVLAAPNGSSGTPTFRSLVAADIPTLNQNTTGNAATASYAGHAGYVDHSLSFSTTGGGTTSSFDGSVARTISYDSVGAPSTGGTNASGTWGINITGNANYASSAGNADTVDNLHVASGRNNSANQIVRTDASGYIQCGYINSSDGNEGINSVPARIWGTNGGDNYLRSYLTSALTHNISIRYYYEAWVDTADKQPLYRVPRTSTLKTVYYWIDGPASDYCTIQIKVDGSTVATINPHSSSEFSGSLAVNSGLSAGQIITAVVTRTATGISNLTVQLDIDQGF